MSKMKEITPQQLNGNPFTMIGKDWTLITAKNGDKVNTMTASWGGMGVMWGADVVFIFVRQSRYTKEFIDASEKFSLTFYDESERKNLSYFGSTSGRDEDKIAKAGYHVAVENDTPYFEEAKTVLLCSKLSRHHMDMAGILDKEIEPRWYAEGNEHDMYIGKIEKVLVRE